MNINLAINEGSKILKGKFIPNPLLDAEILMAKIINKDRNYILINSSNPINKNDLNNFYKLIELRSLGNPIAYLTKKKSFWKSEFLITKDVLIPRPDTELVVENILRLTKQKNKIHIQTGFISQYNFTEKDFFESPSDKPAIWPTLNIKFSR